MSGFLRQNRRKADWHKVATGVLSLLFAAASFAGEPSNAGRSEQLTVGQLSRRIDQALDARRDAKLPTAPPASDGQFIRRASLDLHGVVPTADRVVEFLENQERHKRAALIDELLNKPQYGRHFGLVWFNRMVPRSARATSLVDESLQPWLAERFNQNQGWDTIVRAIMLSEGDRTESPATNFFLAAAGDLRAPHPSPDKVAAAVSRLFLGLRLECCQCHNHPFNDLKQTDFWETAAFFVNLRTGLAPQRDRRPNIVPVLSEGVEVSIKSVKVARPIVASAVIEIPETNGKTVHARFLHGEPLEATAMPIFRPAFATWLTSPTNTQFARAAVNRMWATFFGQGLVDPVDDMQPDRTASHPELLELLTEQFIASGFDLKYLASAIANTQAYQRTSEPPAGQDHDPSSYAHMAARVMTADQLYDSLHQILQREVGEHIANGGQKRKYGDARERFRIYFHGGGDDDNTPAPTYAHGIPQVLRIMNSPALTDGSRLLDQLTRWGATRERVVNRLYLTTLARYPSQLEWERADAFLAAEPDAMRGYSDLLWVLLNSGEFLHNH